MTEEGNVGALRLVRYVGQSITIFDSVSTVLELVGIERDYCEVKERTVHGSTVERYYYEEECALNSQVSVVCYRVGRRRQVSFLIRADKSIKIARTELLGEKGDN